MDKSYCNLKPKACQKLGKVRADDKGYICCNCGKRVSKWIPVCNVLDSSRKEVKNGNELSTL